MVELVNLILPLIPKVNFLPFIELLVWNIIVIDFWLAFLNYRLTLRAVIIHHVLDINDRSLVYNDIKNLRGLC